MNFTNDELYWIERTADIEYSMTMKRFLELCSINPAEFETEKKITIVNISKELVRTLAFLEELRMKMEANRKGEIQK